MTGMKHFHAKVCFTLAVFILLTATVVAQPKSFVNAGVGLNTYVGELNPSSRQRISPLRGGGELNIRLGYTRYIQPRLFLDVAVNVGRIEGSYDLGDDVDPLIIADNDSEINRFFRSNFRSAEVSLNATLTKWESLDLYVGIGFGLLSFEIEDEEGRNLRLAPSTRREGEDYENTTAVVPINAGLILFKNQRVNVLFQVSWNLTNTDYLDNISQFGKQGNDSIMRNLFIIRYGL